MKPATRVVVATSGDAHTEYVAETLAASLVGSVCIALDGSLGAGKTCFVRGLAKGLGIEPTQVCSPSFVYLVEYEGGRTPLVHADLYRLSETPETEAAAVFASIGLTAALAGPGITAVEWWKHYVGPTPQRLVNVEFSIESAEDRRIDFRFSGADLEHCADVLRRLDLAGTREP